MSVHDADVDTSLLMGLVLSGGRSSRMGTDKSLLRYGLLDQRQATTQLMHPFCRRVYCSLHADQTVDEPSLRSLHDDARWSGHGPATGLLTAHHHHPLSAWLVAPCDHPLLTVAALQQLVEARDTSVEATVFVQEDGTLEPLLAVWEPRALVALAAAVEAGRDSSRRLLASLPIRRVTPKDPRWLMDADTPEARERIVRLRGD